MLYSNWNSSKKLYKFFKDVFKIVRLNNIPRLTNPLIPYGVYGRVAAFMLYNSIGLSGIKRDALDKAMHHMLHISPSIAYEAKRTYNSSPILWDVLRRNLIKFYNNGLI